MKKMYEVLGVSSRVYDYGEEILKDLEAREGV